MLVYEAKPLTHVFAEAAQSIINCLIPFFQLHHALSHQVGTSLSAFDPRGECGNLGPEFCDLRVDVIEAHLHGSESVENSLELLVGLNSERGKLFLYCGHPLFERSHAFFEIVNAFCDSLFEHLQVFADRNEFRVEVCL